jgi:hypothetical protein
MSADDSLPDDIETLKQLIRARDAELSRARAEATSAEALIAHCGWRLRSSSGTFLDPAASARGFTARRHVGRSMYAKRLQAPLF